MLSTLACGLLLLKTEREPVLMSMQCQDTWLDRTHSDQNFGRDTSLSVGPDAATLIRFPLVDQTWGSNLKVNGASLTLRVLDKSTPRNLVVSDPGEAWGEGGALGIETDKDGKPVPASNGWATYRAARKGAAQWLTDIGASQEPIKGVTVVVNGDSLTINGLGPLVQSWINDPTKNHGLLLTSSEPLV
ncbi:MAG: hypothetical protein ABUL72_00285, partial [Armatimonadota bacterium]